MARINKKVPTPKKETVRLTCFCCGKNKAESEFYQNIAPMYEGEIQRCHICKECMVEQIGLDLNNFEVIKRVLRKVDRPFLKDIWMNNVVKFRDADGIIKSMRGLLGGYMKDIWMNGYDKFVFADGEALEEKEDAVELSKSEEVDYEDLVKFWGEGFSKKDYEFLNAEYQDLANRFENKDGTQDKIFRNLAHQQLIISKKQARGESPDKELKTWLELMSAGGLKPIQALSASGTDQECFGTLIKKIENEEPIPEPDPEWKDVDGIMKYITVWFHGHLCKMLGLDNDTANIYEEEVSKYTVELQDEEDDE